MITRLVITACALAPALLLVFAPVAQARDLYRYTNEQGNVVVDYRVPTEYVAAGYEVLNSEGVVIRVVPRTLTEEERQAQDAEQLLEERAREEQERLRRWDKSLLLRYSTIADIEDARERALGDLRIRLSILKSNKRSLKHKVENYQAQAADRERSGEQVGLAQLNAIEDLQNDIAATDRAITERQREIEEVDAAYQADIDRFEMLLDVVELRRSMLAQEREAQRKKSSDPRR